ncbi:MAG: Co2+/Mg2+ efflux protein ApaG [Bacteroidia bacterium]|nr:Co2+/Mg2+ efflux protein ApaG [Bacteroidia bacterium]MCC7534154.1 Co2+/Mg2+ efflux protein ApaG [Bacteroidia bacterium]MCZ2141665.1 Co2+/Mg2+ efflux protein ApaG [Bacteroidia bacterium]
MQVAITNDIRITVEVFYQNNLEKEKNTSNMFAYRITISNEGDFTVKLLKRHWYITDLAIAKTEVKGDGVVGLQPVLEPGESHQYVSCCVIESEIGQMYGSYTMERQIDGRKFEVKIPKFNLIVPYRSN